MVPPFRAPPPGLLLAMDPGPPTSPDVDGEPGLSFPALQPQPLARQVVAGQPAGDAPAVEATSFVYIPAEQAPDSTPHQGVGGEPAVGGEPVVGGEPAVGGQLAPAIIIPPWDPEYSTEDVAALRERREWWDLMSWVKRVCK